MRLVDNGLLSIKDRLNNSGITRTSILADGTIVKDTWNMSLQFNYPIEQLKQFIETYVTNMAQGTNVLVDISIRFPVQNTLNK